MQTVAKKNRFLTLISSKELFETKNSSRFYQQLASGLIGNLSFGVNVRKLGDSLISVAERAYYQRRMDLLSDAVELLRLLPLPETYRTISNYHRALYLTRMGDREQAGYLFEGVISDGPDDYKARAMAALGLQRALRGDLTSASMLSRDAMTIALRGADKLPLTVAIANQNGAVVRSLTGDHQGSLRQLADLFPIARLTWRFYPEFYLSYLNSLAVEKGETGQITEANNACKVTLASAFVYAYPEWRETADEISVKMRRSSSTIALSSQWRIASNVFPINVDRTTNTSFQESARPLPERQARVLSFANWKTQMSREPLAKPKPRASIGQMTRKQKIIRIVDLVCNEISDEQLDSILLAVERIAPDEKVKD